MIHSFFYLYLTLCISSNTEDFTITLGSFNTESNPFASYFPIFLNTSNQFTDISKSIFENSFILHFPKEINPSYINFSTIFLDENNYRISKQFVVDDGFFRVGVNGYKKRVKILDPSTHKPYIFNKFAITISESFSNKDPMFLVKEIDSVPFELFENVSFSFKLYISKFDNPPPEPDYLPLIIIICAIVSFISSVIFFFYFKSKGISITIIHLSDLWRVDLFFQNTILVSSVGITYIFAIVIFLLFYYTNSPTDLYRFGNIGMLCHGISSFAYGWTVFYMSRKLFIPEYIAIELCFNTFAISPFIIVSIFNNYIFHSFVGIGILKSILFVIPNFAISFLVCMSFFEFSQWFFDKKLLITPHDENHKNALSSLIPSLKTILEFLFIAISFFFILKPAVDHCFLSFVDDFYFSPLYIVAFVLLYVGIISLLSISHAYLNINKFSNSWQTNHFTLNIIVAFTFAIYLACDIFFVRNYTFKFESLTYCGAYLFSFIPAIMFIGMAPSFYTNFIFFAFIYQSSDREKDEK